jgi:hypothetical protein
MTFSDEQVKTAIHNVVAENGPETTYSDILQEKGMSYDDMDSCKYIVETPTGEPVWACIVGQVMGRLGVEKDLIFNAKVERASSFGLLNKIRANDGIVTEIAGLVGFTPEQAGALGAAQTHQDYGFPWGEALDLFDRALTEETEETGETSE